MERFDIHEGIPAPLDRANVNTDDIIPARFLKSVLRTGFGRALFANWRYLPGDTDPDPAFVLNQDAFCDATVLLGGENFGCGSSREHAPWALAEYGFRCVIAPSFADIFYNNCFNNGILPVALPAEEVAAMTAAAAEGTREVLRVDLPDQVVSYSGRRVRFDIDGFRKSSLLQGLDNIAWTLSHADAIREFEARHRASAPWLFPRGDGGTDLPTDRKDPAHV